MPSCLAWNYHGRQEEFFVQVGKVQPMLGKVDLPLWFIPNDHQHCFMYVRKPLAVNGSRGACQIFHSRWDVFAAGRAKERTSVNQGKTGKPVRSEIAETTRSSFEHWVADPKMIGQEYMWPSRLHASMHLSTRQYARILRSWVRSIGLEPSAYGTHSMRRTKVARATRGQATCERSSFCSAISRWTARFDTSVSALTMRLRSLRA